jgi:hypothetical protein
MPPFLLPVLMVIYSIYHNLPHFLKICTKTQEEWPKAKINKRMKLATWVAFAALMIISPVAFYGDHMINSTVIVGQMTTAS